MMLPTIHRHDDRGWHGHLVAAKCKPKMPKPKAKPKPRKPKR